MADSISEVGDEPVERRESQSVAGSPRLRIHHFLIWTAITALLLAWTRIHLDSWNSTRAHARIEQPTGESTVAYVILGGQITIAICVLRWLQLKLLQKVEPAEWITFIAAVDALLMIWLSIYTTTVEWSP